MTGQKTLLFVYNIDSGVLQSIRDYSASPAAASGEDVHPLSTITHSPLGMKKEWKRFLKNLEIPTRSMDRNEFLTEFRVGSQLTTFPVVLVQKGNELSVLIDTEELNRCRDLDDLMLLVQQRLPQV